MTGATNSNAFQYTGRENDSNGLYFYRARYYSPLLGRFISQDPMGFAGSGPNLYAYAGNSPTNFTDPFGLQTAATGTVTTPYTGTPTPAQVEEALQSVKNATQAAEAAQAAPSLLQSLEGPSIFALATANAELLWTEIQTVTAINDANAAYAAEIAADAKLYAAMRARATSALPSLAGRPAGGSGGELKSCKLSAEFELPSGEVSCAYKCGHWPEAHITVTCDRGQKCKADIPGGWVSKETACE